MSISPSYLAQGNAAMRSGNYEEALKLFDLALAENNNKLSELIHFNILLAQSKLSKQPIDAPKSALDKDPLTVYGLQNSGKSISIVVPVYNALEDVKRCLHSIEMHTDRFNVVVYVINDGSEPATSNWLRDFCTSRPMFALAENDLNQGYTRSVNIGLRKCKGDYIVALNSDTVVTAGWLSALVRCLKSDPRLGVVGPLSNAASWQNVPDLLDKDNKFAVNDLPEDFSPDDMAHLIRRTSKRLYPRVPFVNGFCFTLTKPVLENVGLLDDLTFPTGYGEENDYCIRVAEAGFHLAICDDAYVFHAKSKSFGHEKRKELSKIGSDALKAKHGKERVNQLGDYMRKMEVFSEIRQQIKDAMTKKNKIQTRSPLLQSILFLLPVSGGGGGVHSIVQEAMGMQRIGVDVKIAVPKKHRSKFLAKYQDIDISDKLFLGFETHELSRLSKEFHVIVGTIFTSMKMIKDVVDSNPSVQPAYYVQDYEPLFFQHGMPEWHEARASYTLVPGTILFAKTDWICQKVEQEHGVYTHKVTPSIDHDVYKPDPHAKKRSKLENEIVLAAMIRPKTPRRGAKRTMHLLKQIYNYFGNRVHIDLFGCDDNDPLFLELDREFVFINNGELTRLGVAAVLQKADCFLDLSDYQAFGRTGLEAMACGAFLVTTSYGGIREYAVDGVNSIFVDVFDEKQMLSAVISVLESKSFLRMKENALLTASRYNIHSAAVSELLALSRP